jgi:exodeoxyribonuclease VIII
MVPKTWDSRTKEGKIKDREYDGRTVSRDDFQTVFECLSALQRHPIAGPLISEALTNNDTEVSAFGKATKARFDGLASGYVIDLKTTSDASPERFARSCVTFGYNAQAAHYLDVAREVGVRAGGLHVERFVLIAVETQAPYSVACYTLSRDFLDSGRIQNFLALQKIEEARRTNIWPGYDADPARGPLIRELQLPHGAAYEFADLKEQHSDVLESLESPDDF